MNIADTGIINPQLPPMAERRMLVHTNGESFVFRNEEIDVLFKRIQSADTTVEAWETTEQYGKELNNET